MRRLIGVVAAVVLVAACSEGQSTDEAVIESLQASLLRDETFDTYELTENEAGCVATRAVESLGAERMVEIGAADEAAEAEGDDLDFGDLSDEEIITMGDAMEDCVSNIDALLVDVLSAEIVANESTNQPITESQALCIAEAAVEQLSLSRMILLGVRGAESGGGLQSDEIDVYADAWLSCTDIRADLLGGIGAEGAPEGYLDCLDERVTDDDLRQIVVTQLAGEDSDAAAQDILGPAVEACS